MMTLSGKKIHVKIYGVSLIIICVFTFIAVSFGPQSAAAETLPGVSVYAFDRLSPETTRLSLMNAFGVGILGIIIASSNLRRSFAQVGQRLGLFITGNRYNSSRKYAHNTGKIREDN